MTAKEKIAQAIDALPADASFEDAMERLLLLSKIERGLYQLDSGEGIPHAEARARMSKWLK